MCAGKFRGWRYDKRRRTPNVHMIRFGHSAGGKKVAASSNAKCLVMMMVVMMVGNERLKIRQGQEIMMTVETRVEWVLKRGWRRRGDRMKWNGGRGNGGDDGENQRSVE